MANLVPIEDDKGNQIYIEVIPTGNQSGIKQTSKDTGVADKLTADDFKRMIRQAVMPTCQTFVDVWQELNQPLTADSAEVEFNLGFTASGNAVIMQASGQASFKVKVSWKFKETFSSHFVFPLAVNENDPLEIRNDLAYIYSYINKFEIDKNLTESAIDKLELTLKNKLQGDLSVKIQTNIKELRDIVTSSPTESVGGTTDPPPLIKSINNLTNEINSLF